MDVFSIKAPKAAILLQNLKVDGEGWPVQKVPPLPHVYRKKLTKGLSLTRRLDMGMPGCQAIEPTYVLVLVHTGTYARESLMYWVQVSVKH